MTTLENQSVEEQMYGNGKVIGKEIDDEIKFVKETSDKKKLSKQPGRSNMSTKTFLSYMKDREAAETPILND